MRYIKRVAALFVCLGLLLCGCSNSNDTVSLTIPAYYVENPPLMSNVVQKTVKNGADASTAKEDDGVISETLNDDGSKTVVWTRSYYNRYLSNYMSTLSSYLTEEANNAGIDETITVKAVEPIGGSPSVWIDVYMEIGDRTSFEQYASLPESFFQQICEESIYFYTLAYNDALQPDEIAKMNGLEVLLVIPDETGTRVYMTSSETDNVLEYSEEVTCAVLYSYSADQHCSKAKLDVCSNGF